MTRDLSKRLARIEAQSAPLRQARFLALEGPPGLPEAEATAFLRACGHSWGQDDIVFVTTYESRDPNAPLRDVTPRPERAHWGIQAVLRLLFQRGGSGTRAMAGEGKRFEQGQTGNPAGRPKGARHKVTLAVETLLEGEAEALTRKAVEMALDGDTVAMRLCLDRIAPVRKDRPIVFALPPIATTADLPKATAALLEAVAAGDLAPAEASDISRTVDAHVKAIEVTDLHARLAKLEEARL